MNTFSKRLLLAVTSLLFAMPSAPAAQPVPLLPSQETDGQREVRLRWWRDAKFGLFIHWGPASLSGKEISWARIGHPFDHQGLESVPAEVYDKLYERFNPVKFDAPAWMRLARDAGMKYVVFITKHHDGFSMWPTKLRPEYSISATPFKRDICGEIANAAHQQGLKLGWYYSTRDWTHPDYLKDGNARYNDFYHGQIGELLSNYGRVDMLWFDHVAGNWRDYRFQELFGLLYELQPGILVNNRAAAFIRGTEDRPEPEIARLVRGDFDTPEQQIGKFQNERPWESCVTLTHCADGGGWSYRPDGRTRGFEECLRMLVNCVTGDGNLLLNVGPLPTGEIDPQQVQVLQAMGEWLNRFGESIYATRGGPFRNGAWGGSVYRDKSIYLHVFRWSGDTLKLPALKGKVLRATALTGGAADFKQTGQGLIVTLPYAQQDKVNTVLRLDLESSAADELVGGKPLEVQEPVCLNVESPRDYQVFQRHSLQEGAVRVAGHVPPGTDRLEVRLAGEVPDGHTAGKWAQLSLDAQGSFRADLNAPAGGWYACEVRAFKQGELVGTTTVAHVGVGEVFVVAGQSNSSNHGSEKQQPRSGKVTAFDGTNWRVADDPQPGASGSGGSFIPAFGDALVDRCAVPIGVASVGVGGTSVREWLPKGERMTNQPTTGANVKAVGPHEWEATGDLFERLAHRLAVLGPNGCRAVLWHQGESDAGQARAGYPADRQITGEQYCVFMEKLVQAARARAGWEVPWMTAQATYHTEQDPADDEFRAAQAKLRNTGLVLEGPDTDTLRVDCRDGVHFNAKGLRRHGEMWAEKVAAWIDQ